MKHAKWYQHQFALPLICAFGMAFLLISCLTEIPLEAPRSDSENLSIRGALVLSEAPHVLVKITLINDFTTNDTIVEIKGAQVILENEEGMQMEIPGQGRGQYFLDLLTDPLPFAVGPGHSYRLLVYVPSGKTYVSAFEPMNAVPQPTAITQQSQIRTILNEYGNDVEQEFLRFFVTTPITNGETDQGAYLKWSSSGVYRFSESAGLAKICYVHEDLNLENVVTFNGQGSRKDVLTDFFLLEEPYDFRFYEGYYLSVRQQSLSSGAYRYWDQTSKVVNRTGDIFEEPAGKVLGNFQNPEDPEEEVFGYFYATQESVIRYRVQRGESRIRYICSLDPRNPYFLCTNCLDHPKSSLDKPEYWED